LRHLSPAIIFIALFRKVHNLFKYVLKVFITLNKKAVLQI